MPLQQPLNASALRRRLRSLALSALAALAIAPGATLAQTPVQDPAGRFTFTAPKGWTVTSREPQAIVVTAQDASVTLTVSEGAEPAAISQAVLGQVQSQWQGYQEIKRGTATVGGRSGPYVFVSGRNPKGVPSFFRVVAIPAANGALVIMASVPQERFGETKAALEALEASVQLAAAPRNPNTPPAAGPSPAVERRLAALEQAYASGVLSQDEYEAKKRALLGGPPPAGADPAPPLQAAGARAYAGIASRNIEPDEAGMLRVQQGALVGQVAPGGPAEAAGLRPWDVIIALDGAPVADSPSLVQAIGRKRPGDTITLRVVRQGQTGELPVRLGTAPPR